MFSLTTTMFTLPFLSAMVSASQVNLNALFKPHLSSGARIILPSSPNYTTQVIQRWTVWEDPTYIGAIQPATEEDVEQIVKIAAKHGIPFLATGAGHGFGLGFGQVQNAIDIDLSQFKSVAIDAENNILTVGGSVTFSDIFQPLYDVGKEVPTGNIPCVGMVGATLGAGVGPLQGLHGFIIDSLHSVRLTTASGDTVTVSKTENPDLFWAIRGAGANFGIITSANYTIYDSTNGGQVINADFLYAASANTSVFEALASFDEYIPSELGLSVEMSFNQTSKEAILVVNFIFFGNQTEAQPYLDRFNSIDYLLTDLQYVSWPELDGFGDFGQNQAGGCTTGVWDNVYTVGLGQTDISTLESYFADFVAFSLTQPDYIGVLAIQRYGTEVTESIPAHETVYPWRNVKSQGLFLNTLLNSSINAEIDAFMQGQRTKFQNTSGFPCLEAYINYSHGDEGPEVWYGAENLPKLRALKAKWDPQNLFRGGRSVYST